MLRSLFLVAVLGLLAGPAAGQHRSLDRLPPDTRALVAERDAALPGPTRRTATGRVDAETGLLRAAYRVEAAGLAGAPGPAARAVLAQAGGVYGWQGTADDLALERVATSRYSSHAVFQQTLDGIPVLRRQVKVNLDAAGQPTQVFSGYAPHVRAADLDTQPALAAAEAEAHAAAAVSAVQARTTAAQLVVVPTKTPHLAWRVVAYPADYPAEWEVLVDAHSGMVLQLLDLSTHGGAAPKPTTPAASTSSTAPPAPSAAAVATGSGYVFDPNPLSQSGSFYGDYIDDGDADSAVNEQLLEVQLLDVTQGGDGLYRLRGPHVQITGDQEVGNIASYDPPAEADPDAFRYTRADDRFEAVNAYYHIDKSQRYVQALDLGRAIQEAPLRVNPHGLGAFDDSRYFTAQNAIAFGQGGVDDAEDADVIWHEYAHALLEGSAPGLLGTPEGRALHEGWADYWAASYGRSLVEAGLVPRGDWRTLFEWDSGDGFYWAGRTVEHGGVYPDDTGCDDGMGCDIYEDGLLWAAALMEIQDDLGRTVTDRLALASHAYLSAPVTFRDAAEALVQADRDLYDGAHLDALLDRLSARGLLQGPALAHEPLLDTEQTGGTVAVSAEAFAASGELERVQVFYAVGPEAPLSEVLEMAPVGGEQYEAALPLPADAATVRYYLEATDAAGLTVRLPAGAPNETYQFQAGPDSEAPRIDHQPIVQATIAAWPARVVATVTDNLGIDSVWVEYSVDTPGGEPRASGRFALEPIAAQGEALTFEGGFPAGAAAEGDVVTYRVIARDASSAQNVAVLPEEGDFRFTIAASGLVRAYDFEVPAGELDGTGTWQQGPPSFGLQTAWSGDNVIATYPQAPYPGEAQRSVLDLPPANLTSTGGGYLVYWHWYDFEHDGTARPDRFTGATLWDGGNVKVSVDGGTSWTVATPEAGYSGQIAGGTGNPLAGEPAFGGYSYGWRRVIVPLPPAADVRVRFDMGSDESNLDASLSYAGWYLDDLTITTDYPADDTPPDLLSTPMGTVRRSGEPAPPFEVRAEDAGGIADALVLYTIQPDPDAPAPTGAADTLRLAMDLADRQLYRGRLALPALDAGAVIRYRYLLGDGSGNRRLVPAADQAALAVRYRYAEQADALQSVLPTGAWTQAGAAWRLEEAAQPSSLVLVPNDLPANADSLRLLVRHRYTLGAQVGGVMRVSDDGGTSWAVLEPEGGYPAQLGEDGVPVFQGSTASPVASVFDLSGYAGEQVRVRLDFLASADAPAGTFWEVEAATWSYSDDQVPTGGFEVPRELALHANFPDPFAASTTVGYTLSEAAVVRLAVYDMLGRRVAVLVDGRQAAGTYTLPFRADGLASGVYLLRFTAGGQQRVEQMVVAR